MRLQKPSDISKYAIPFFTTIAFIIGLMVIVTSTISRQNQANATIVGEVTTFSYTGGYQVFTASSSGYYEIETIGAAGQTNGTWTGGEGGISKGRIYLDEGEKLYVYVGSQATFNGGGRNNATYGGAGGAATDIRYFGKDYTPNATELTWNNATGLNSRIMVAGGGGGGGWRQQGYGNGEGGDGGGLKGGDGTRIEVSVSYGGYIGYGGSQTEGGHTIADPGPSVGASDTITGTFGSGASRQSAGGSGYYGGGSADHGGSGGGSSYISGYLGSVAIAQGSTTEPRAPRLASDGITTCTEAIAETDVTCSEHYSGKVFDNITMTQGGNSSNLGSATITFRGISDDYRLSPISGNVVGGETLELELAEPISASEQDITIKLGDHEATFTKIDDTHFEIITPKVYVAGTVSITLQVSNSTVVYEENAFEYYYSPFDSKPIFDYVGTGETYVVPADGTYKIQMWGAGGYGARNAATTLSGAGGYNEGEIYLTKGTILYVYVGQRGIAGYFPTTLSFNGGGVGTQGGGGAGSTDVRLYAPDNLTIWNDAVSLRSRIMVAGAGGGRDDNIVYGGAAGGLSGSPGNVYTQGGTPGQPGTQTSAGAVTDNWGGFGHGNSQSPSGAGAGGGGYYGGSGGYQGNGNIGGGGGSSFISGHLGAVAVVSSAANTAKCTQAAAATNQACSEHYSGLTFTNTVMTNGYSTMPSSSDPEGSTTIGNITDGKVIITPLDIELGTIVYDMYPNTGTEKGGTYVTLEGVFSATSENDLNIKVGNVTVPTSDITLVDNETIRFKTPAGTVGETWVEFAETGTESKSYKFTYEESFSATSITPDEGEISGLETVTITGTGFNVTPDYIQDGLVLHLDGIQNTVAGYTDKTATTWEDLSGNGNDVTFVPGTGSLNWTNNGFLFSGTSYFERAYAGLNNIPFGASAFTAQTYYSVKSTPQVYANFLIWGAPSASNTSVRLDFNNGTANQYRFGFWNNDLTVPATNANAVGTSHTISASYDGSYYRSGYADGQMTAFGGVSEKNTTAGVLRVGARSDNLATSYAAGMEISSIRIYDRDLSEREVNCNAAIDRARFGGEVDVDFSDCLEVKIDDKECLNPTIIDNHTITCNTSMHEAGDNLDVTVSYGGETSTMLGAYSYVNNFDVTDLDDEDGDASGSTRGGELITITGESLIPDYIMDGLVSRHDGIANTGSDANHSTTTRTWWDVSGNGNNAYLYSHAGATTVTGWQANSYYFLNNQYFRVPAGSVSGLPFGNDNYTIETNYNYAAAAVTSSGLIGFGGQANYTSNSIYFGAANNVGNIWLNSDFYLGAIANSGAANFQNTASFTYDNTSGRKGYMNGAYVTTNAATTKNTMASELNIGKTSIVNTYYGTNSRISSVRIYNRQLTDKEVACNAQIDNYRFGTGAVDLSACVEIKLGDEICTNPTIIDDQTITCRTPRHDAGTVDAEVSILGLGNKTLTDVYTYEAAFAVDSIEVDGEAEVHGPSKGGTEFTITGKGFVPDYVKDGLVAHFDGINNTIDGFSNSTTTWYDISGNGNHVNLVGTLAGTDWVNNGFYFNNNKYFTTAYGNLTNIPFGNSQYTLESYYHSHATPSAGATPVSYGSNATNVLNDLRLQSNTQVGNTWGNNDLFYPVPNAWTANTAKHTVSATWDGTTRKGYSDGVKTNQAAASGKNTSTSGLFIGQQPAVIAGYYMNDLNLKSVRIYNRALTEREVECNAQMDAYRFDNGVDLSACIEIKVGDAVCTLMQIIDENTIKCTTTEHTAGEVDVVVDMLGESITVGTLEDAYTYDQTVTITDTSIDASETYGTNEVIVTGTGFLPSNYLADGLVGHYDSINNTASGHTDTGSYYWRDITGNNDTYYSGTTVANKWTADGFYINDNTYFRRDTAVVTGLPLGANPVTQETYYKNTSAHGVAYPTPISYGGNATSQTNALRIRDATSFFVEGWSNDLIFYGRDVKTVGTVHGLSGVFTGSQRTGYWNGVDTATAAASKNITQGNLTIGVRQDIATSTYSTGLSLRSIRQYNKALTEQEITCNYQYDQIRFGDFPSEGVSGCVEVTIDDVPCLNITVLSDTTLKCTTPTNLSPGDNCSLDVRMPTTDETATKEFGYEQTLVIDSVTPSSGLSAGGQTVTMTGKGFTPRIVKDGLVAWYDGRRNACDENGDSVGHSTSTTEWCDLSGQGNHISLVGTLAPTDWIDNAFSFNNNKYFQRLLTSGINGLPLGNSNYTIESRYNVASTPNTQALFVSYGVATNYNAIYFGFTNASTIRNGWSGTDATWAVSGATAIGSTHNMSFSYDGAYRRGYYDGISSGAKSLAITLTRVTSATNLMVGNYVTNNAAHTLNGLNLQSLRIYDRTLTDAEITSNKEADDRWNDGITALMDTYNCTEVNIISDTELTCTTPAHENGWVPVSVDDGVETSAIAPNGFLYQPPMNVYSISPDYGPIAGGTEVTIIGENFDNSLEVHIGGIECENIIFDIDTPTEKLTCETGESLEANIYDVVLSKNNGDIATLVDGYLYHNDITVTAIDPENGPVEGGQLMEITGSGFAGGGSVTTTAPQDFSYTGNYQAFTAPVTGRYYLEAWGAAGGEPANLRTQGGKGGYSAGMIRLNQGETIYIYVGQQRSDNVAAFNAGSIGGTSIASTGQPRNGHSGGGATDFRYFGDYTPTSTELDWSNDLSLRSRIMVAGGGGGGNDYIATLAPFGGYGGGLIGESGKQLSNNANFTPPSGGTQIAGGNNGAQVGGALGTAGTFGIGGNGNGSWGSGGGGGYWGGGGAGYISNVVGSGAGGSSYISGHTGSVAITNANSNTPKAGCDTGNTDPTCSYHYSGKIFTDTMMIDGGGYIWTNEQDTEVTGVPNPAGGDYATGREGSGYARITLQALPAPTVELINALDEELTCTDVTVISDTKLTCVTSEYPDGGITDVKVSASQMPDDIYGTLEDAYTYVLPPVITSISPNHGPLTGGTEVTIEGENFFYGTEVTLGGVACANVTFDATTPTEKLTCTIGSSTVIQAVDVVVDNQWYTATLPGGYLYHDPITVSSITPTEGTVAGGTEVTITGSGFDIVFAADDPPEDYTYTGQVQSFTAPYSTYYDLEAWGAQGGTYATNKGGMGSYTSGKIWLDAGETIYIYVGAHNTTGVTNVQFNFNGGGCSHVGNNAQYDCGGGATDFRMVEGPTATTWDNPTSLKSRIMVAAGGAGRGNNTGSNMASAAGGGLKSFGLYPAYQTYTTNLTGSPGFGWGARGISAQSYSGSGGGWFGGGALNLAAANGGATGGSSYISGHLGSIGLTNAAYEQLAATTVNTSPNASAQFKGTDAQGASDIYLSYSPTGKIFTDTVMIDGQGYGWNTAQDTASGIIGVPNPSGGTYATGNEGQAHARVSITGAISYAPVVTFDIGNLEEASCVDIVVISDTELTCTTSAHSEALVDVTVGSSYDDRVYDTLEDAYLYIPALEIHTISPSNGPLEGGTEVTITGVSFDSSTTVTIGDVQCTNVTLDIDNPSEKLTCTTGAYPHYEYVDVVATKGSETAELVGGYLYHNPITITSIEPDKGPTAGGTEITITGTNFTESIYGDYYVKDGLVAHYDGINNTGDGHSTTTNTWADISGNNNHVTLNFGTISDIDWEEDGFYFNNSKYFIKSSFTGIPLGNSPYSFETHYTVGYPPISAATFAYYGNVGSSTRQGAMVGFSGSNIRNDWSNAGATFAATGATTVGNTNNISVSYDGTYRNGFFNGVRAQQVASSGLNLTASTFVIGNINPYAAQFALDGITIHAQRVYSRALTEQEVACNTAMDRVRFEGSTTEDFSNCVQSVDTTEMISEVLIDGLECTNLTVISDTKATCTTPAHIAGLTDVSITSIDNLVTTSEDAYLYVPPPTITAVDPTTGFNTGGEEVTLTGTGFSYLSSVLFGTETCTSLTIISDTSATCETPVHTDGFVDVVVTNIINQTDTLTNGFQFIPPWHINLTTNKPGFILDASPIEDISTDVVIATTETNWLGGYTLSVSQGEDGSDLICTEDTSLVLPTTTIDNSASLSTNSYGIGTGTVSTPPPTWRTVSTTPRTVGYSLTDGTFIDYVYLGISVDLSQSPCDAYEGVLVFSAVMNP